MTFVFPTRRWRLRTGISGYALASYASVGAGAVTSVVLARAMRPSERGAIALVAVIVASAPVIFGLGLSGATSASVARRDLEPQLALSYAYGLLFKYSPLFLIASLPLVFEALPRVTHEKNVVILSALALALVGAGFRQPEQGLLYAEHRLWAYAALNYSPLAVNLCGVLVLAVADRITISSVTILYIVGITVQIILGLSFTHEKDDHGAGSVRRPPAWFVRRAMRGYPGQALDVLSVRGDQMLLLLVSGRAALGVYVVAVSAAFALAPLGSGYGSRVLSHCGGTHANPVETWSRFASIHSVALRVSVVIAIIWAAVSWLLIPLIFGHAYSHARVYVPILLTAQVVQVSVVLLSEYAYAIDRQGLVSLTRIVGTGFLVVTAIPLGIFYGGLGVSFSVLLGQLVQRQYIIRALQKVPRIGLSENLERTTPMPRGDVAPRRLS